MRFRKSFKVAPGVKLNINKKSFGVTVGTRGAHYTANSKGGRTTTVGIPGTGLYYTDIKNKKRKLPNNLISDQLTNNTSEDYQNEYPDVFSKEIFKETIKLPNYKLMATIYTIQSIFTIAVSIYSSAIWQITAFAFFIFAGSIACFSRRNISRLHSIIICQAVMMATVIAYLCSLDYELKGLIAGFFIGGILDYIILLIIKEATSRKGRV